MTMTGRFACSLLTLVTTLAGAIAGTLSDTFAHAGPIHPYAIYGSDDRLEIYADKDPARKILAESVVAIIDRKDLQLSSGNLVTIAGKLYGEVNDLCPSERFVEQTETAYCSGFLVADNIVATAGHCVTDKTFCKDARFVFDYMLDDHSRNPNTVTTDDVYGCRKVLHDEVTSGGSDYALVELDRPVVGRQPLSFATKPTGEGDSVFIIGHPSGLPAKVAAGANVLEDSRDYFVTNLDAFTGNSGAAVFNQNYEVVGVLVRGEVDFVEKGGCNVVNRCPLAGLCIGEDVSKAEPIAKKLAKLQSSSKVSSNSRPVR